MRKVLFLMMALGMTLASCTNKAPEKEQPIEEPAAAAPDSDLVAAAEDNIKAHQEDIDAFWKLTFGEDKKIANYYLANNDVFLSTEDGKDGVLVTFYKDARDANNFDCVPVRDGQELSFQGDALVIRDNDKITYFAKTESEGYNELFSEAEKDGKKSYTNDKGEPYDEKEAQAFLDKIGKEKASPLSDILVKWK